MVNASAQAADERSSGGWTRHVVGVGLGVLVVAALVGHARLVFRLQGIGAREFVSWPLSAELGLLLLWGVVVALVVKFSPRVPALPTVVAIVLLYGIFASVPPPTFEGQLLPVLGPWQPVVAVGVGGHGGYTWPGSALVLMAGAMTAAAVWGWWSYAAGVSEDRTEET